MKKILVLILGLVISLFNSYGQYVYYNPYSVAQYSAEEFVRKQHIQELNNIRFDEKEILKNEQAYTNYLTYCQAQNDLSKKSKTYDIIGYSGLGVGIVALYPLYKGLTCDYDDPNEDKYYITSLSLLGIGTLLCTVCYIGELSINSKMVENKENFIFYLKTYNNGIGIVTLF